MKPLPACLLALSITAASGQDKIQTKTTYAKAYGETKNAVAVDPAKDLPSYPAVEPKDAIGTWQVKKGFKLQLAAHEPQVRDPIAICFDERGRMFVCEMIDYSEMREVTPHLGRVSMLQDKDGDGYFETSQVFADDLPWPTGLIWANGGLYVGATPDIWRFEDKDGDGKAEVRQKVFTGFGTGLKILNVQGLMNSFQWGQDNRVHVLAGGGNRGIIRRVGVSPASGSSGVSPEQPGGTPGGPSSGGTPDLQDGNRGIIRRVGVPPASGSSSVSPEQPGGTHGGPSSGGTPDLHPDGIELGGKDFWFDPLTHEFGLEGGGAQYGMSFDTYGRKFGCSNSDHLQYWAYDDKYANRNPYYQMPPARQSIAADGGAAEVFRISPDEPWRIIRTRWRIAGVVKGVVEGGGRVSGYFTGATGTTIYRGDAYGPEFVNNSFSGDAGGQLVHRKVIRPAEDGISLVGERPADEHGFEFAASKDTWVRVVNFANAPDGCLHICDMYRQVIEHPWSIPDEIKKHLDLNNGNDRGRVYRIVPEKGAERIGQRVNLANASLEDLVKTLAHPDGWHRDTAQRLLYERQDKAAVPLLEKVLTGDNALAKLHALGALEGLRVLQEPLLANAVNDANPRVAERALALVDRVVHSGYSQELCGAIGKACDRDDPRVRFQILLMSPRIVLVSDAAPNNAQLGHLVNRVLKLGIDSLESGWLKAAILAANPDVGKTLLPVVVVMDEERKGTAFQELIELFGASVKTESVWLPNAPKWPISQFITWLASNPKPSFIKAFGVGLKKAGTTLEQTDTEHKLTAVFTKAATTAGDSAASAASRLEAIELIGLAPSKESRAALLQCLGDKQPDAVQTAAIKTLSAASSEEITKALLQHWPHYGAKARAAALDAMLARDDRVTALLEAGVMKPAEFSASQVQALIKHKDAKVAALAKTVLASVIPPSREEVVAKFKPALATKGDATRGQNQFISRCMACHRAGTMGLQVGPDLVTVKTKGRDGILTAILEPHKEVASQFIAYTVGTKDGQTLTGIIADDNATSLTLKMMGGLTQTIQRGNIKGSSSSGQSLMPEGLEQGMSPQDMADLLDFIESLK